MDQAINDDAEFIEEHIYAMSGEGEESRDPVTCPDLFPRLVEAQGLDRVTSDAIAQFQRDGVVVSGQLKKFYGLKILDGILYRRNRIIISASLRQCALELVHRTCHGGIQRTIEELKKRFYWRGMYSDIEATQELCRLFREQKIKLPQTTAYSHQTEVGISSRHGRVRHSYSTLVQGWGSLCADCRGPILEVR